MNEWDEVFSALYASYRRIGQPDAVLAAVSGGADSTALLLALHTLRMKHDVRILCAHVDHGLRPDSAEDASFVRDLAQRMEIPYYGEKVFVNRHGSVEAQARTARYDALFRIAKDHGIHCIATAHHREDQAETMLMHLMYGSGTSGLCGIREWSNGVWRPFLNLNTETLKNYLRIKKQVWRTDETNQSLSFTRNRIRMKILPEMEAMYPSFAEKMSNTAQILAEEDKVWENMANQWLLEHGFLQGGLHWINRSAFSAASVALQRRILLALGERAGITLDFATIGRILKANTIEGVSTVNLPGDAQAYVTQGRIHFLRDVPREPWKGGRVLWSFPAMQIGDGGFTQAFDADKIRGARLRTRLPGDTIVPLGQTGKQSLKQYLIDRKIDRPFRDVWPIYALGNDVLWVVGIGASEHAAICRTTKDTAFAVYEGILPDGRTRGGGKDEGI